MPKGPLRKLLEKRPKPLQRLLKGKTSQTLEKAWDNFLEKYLIWLDKVEVRQEIRQAADETIQRYKPKINRAAQEGDCSEVVGQLTELDGQLCGVFGEPDPYEIMFFRPFVKAMVFHAGCVDTFEEWLGVEVPSPSYSIEDWASENPPEIEDIVGRKS